MFILVAVQKLLLVKRNWEQLVLVMMTNGSLIIGQVSSLCGENLPNGVDFSGKSIYISGARYSGPLDWVVLLVVTSLVM